MTYGRSRSRAGMVMLAAMLAVIGTFMVTPAAQAQDRLSNELVVTQNLTPEQQQAVQMYVDQWAGVMLDPESPDRDIVRARGRLTEPFNLPGSSDAFRALYSQIVGQRLAGTLNSSDLIVRLNVLILASRLNLNPQVLPIIQQGLDDESPAVRYWAVKAIRSPGGGGGTNQLDADARQDLIMQLEQILQDEPALEVIEQVLLAMVDLEQADNNALERVVVALDRRVQAHVGQPRMPFRAETAGMQAAYSRLLYAQENRGGMDPVLSQMAAAAVKYLTLVAELAQHERFDPQLQDDFVAMANLTHTILSQIHQRRGSTAPVPTALEFRQNATNYNWAGLASAAQQYRDMLMAPPIGLPEQAVTVARAQ